ncbi:MAG: hypothetical protein MK074_01015 [Phycisphaerales bacterium]|nr:hypothetical protein [Phycisphaerales bacterium]
MASASVTNANSSNDGSGFGLGWAIVIGIFVVFSIGAWFALDAGKVYTLTETVTYSQVDDAWVSGAVDGAAQQVSWETSTAVNADTPGAALSASRTIGVWLAAILTLCIMSFLAGDNPFYKAAEAIVVGASAAYWMVLSFWTGIVDKLLVNLIPDITRAWAVPGLPESASFDVIYLIPLVLSGMLIWRLSPKGGWIARWPLAFVIGATAGFRLLSHLESDFLLQIKSTITPLYVTGADGFQFWPSVGALVILLGVLCCLVYFFFSMEHKGAVGKTARMGIYVLMVTFGAAFGLTVMGRITLLTERFDFLFREWLNLL